MSLLDKFLPRHQFSERHQTMVRCEPGRLLDIIQNFEQPDDRLARALMLVRQLPARLLRRSVRPFTVKSFTPLARDGDREVAAGLIGRFWRPDMGLIAVGGPEEFKACNPSRTAKLVIVFRAERAGDATRLITETGVYCPDRYALIMFAPYWLAIRAVSGLLRRRGLAAIRNIAEGGASG